MGQHCDIAVKLLPALPASHVTTSIHIPSALFPKMLPINEPAKETDDGHATYMGWSSCMLALACPGSSHCGHL